eukprot:m.105012 g.105012  ORF g.105012 m.105012 type:complete len:219 (+) comp15689_c0_seq1:152-808(+)
MSTTKSNTRVSTFRTTDFPLYGVAVTGDRRVILAGGGGHGKHGVPNALEVYGLEADGTPVCLNRFQPEGSVSNVALHPKLAVIAAGVDANLHIFKFGGVTANADKGRRSPTSPSSSSRVLTVTSEPPSITNVSTQRSDHGDDGGFQNVVRFSHDGSRVATGGDDGRVRVWAYPSLKLQHTLGNIAGGVPGKTKNKATQPTATKLYGRVALLLLPSRAV